MTTLSIRSGFLALLLCSCLTACDYVPGWMGGRKDATPKLAGDRIAVLPVDTEMQPDAALATYSVTLPAASPNPDWPQHAGSVTSATGNLAGGSFENESHTSAGNGEGFEHMLVPRPVIGGGAVFTMDAIGNISAHEAANIDHMLWESAGIAEEDEPEIIGGGLAFDQGKLYATSGRGIVAMFDASTGKEVWRKALHIPFRSAPRVAGDKLFAVTIDNQLYALNTANGEVVWSQRGIAETAGLMNSVSPAVDGDTVIAPYSSGEIYAYATSDGHPLWSNSLTSSKHTEASASFAGIGGDPIVDGGVVFAISSGDMLTVMTANTGQRMWERPIGSINTPWLAGDLLYVLTSDNTVLCMVKYDGRVRWATKLASFEDEELKRRPITWKGPIVINGKVVVISNNGQLQSITAEDGKMLAVKEIPEGVATAPVVAGGRMYLVSQDATLYSLQ